MTETIDISVNKVSQSKIGTLDVHNIPFAKIYSDHMFEADYRDGEWKNFRIVPYQNISVSPANNTLHYAITVFEGMKAYKNDAGEVLLFRPEANAKRLNISAERMCIPELPEELFMEALANGYLLYLVPHCTSVLSFSQQTNTLGSDLLTLLNS